MTRLLMPEMFGLMTIAQLMYFGLSLISDVGLQQNLIQSHRNDERFINSIWTAQIIRGVFIWVMGILASIVVWGLAQFSFFPSHTVYANSLLPWLIVGSTANAFISGFTSTRIAEQSKKLSLGKSSFMSISSQLIGMIVMVVWAKVSPSVWALVIGSIVSSMTNVIFSHTLIKGTRNRIIIDRNELVEIFHFGKWILLTSLLGFLAMNADKIILGLLVDSTTLGVYSVAFMLMNAPKEILIRLVNGVVFPAMSEVYRSKPNEVASVYYKFRFKFDFICFTMVGFLFATGPTFVTLLYDARYDGAGLMLSILALSVLDVRYFIADQCYIAQGKPQWLTPLIGMHVLSVFIFTPICFHYWGVAGAVWAIALSGFARLPVVFYLKHISGLLDLKKELYFIPTILLGYGLGRAFQVLF